MAALAHLQWLDDRYAVAPQVLPEDLPAIAAAGFRSVFNMRPDHEGGPRQPTHAALVAAAQAAGLAIAWVPVQSNHQSTREVAAFGQALASLPAPVLAFCRSGARATLLYVTLFPERVRDAGRAD